MGQKVLGGSLFRVDHTFPIALIQKNNSNIPAFRQHWSPKCSWGYKEALCTITKNSKILYFKKESISFSLVLLLQDTQHSGNLVEVMVLLIAWSGHVSSNVDPWPFSLFYSMSQSIPDCPSKSESPTPCLYCCYREIRRALYQPTK